jgi:hypothetical protein
MRRAAVGMATASRGVEGWGFERSSAERCMTVQRPLRGHSTERAARAGPLGSATYSHAPPPRQGRCASAARMPLRGTLDPEPPGASTTAPKRHGQTRAAAYGARARIGASRARIDERVPAGRTGARCAGEARTRGCALGGAMSERPTRGGSVRGWSGVPLGLLRLPLSSATSPLSPICTLRLIVQRRGGDVRSARRDPVGHLVATARATRWAAARVAPRALATGRDHAVRPPGVSTCGDSRWRGTVVVHHGPGPCRAPGCGWCCGPARQAPSAHPLRVSGTGVPRAGPRLYLPRLRSVE